jgi:diguanylate cyclase (GGDEF)-like protein
VVLIDPKTEYLEVENSHGLSLTFCNSFRRRIAAAAIGRLVWTGEPVLIPDAELQPAMAEEVRLEHSFASCACVQIAVDERPLGYIYADSREKNAFTERGVDMMRVFGDIAALAINKSRLFEQNLRLERIDRESGLEKYLPFIEKLHVGISRARDFGERCGVLLLDVDNFKETVNTYGYTTSRELLRELGGRIKTMMRPVDAGGRYGFDEFILMLANTDQKSAVTFARDLIKDVSERSFTSKKIRSTISVGVAVFPQNGETVEELLTTAKKALFEAQRGGRNSVRFYEREWYAQKPE